MVPRIAGLVLLLALSTSLASAQGTTRPSPPQPAAPEAAATIADVLRAAREKYDGGQKAEALDLVRSVLKTAVNNPEANLLAAEMLYDANDYNSARDHFKKVIDSEPSNFKANLGLGKIWVASRYWRAAMSYLQVAEKVAPEANRAEVKRLLAQTLAAVGQTQKGLEKAEEAIQADPDNLDALQNLVEIRQSLAAQDPLQLEPTLAAADKLVQKALQAVERKPWERDVLSRLDKAYDMKSTVLRTYHNSFYQRDVRKAAVDRLEPGKGGDAAAVLVRLAETTRAQALLKLILAEHDAIELTRRAVTEEYDAKNVKFLESLAASYRQLEELTVRLAGPGVVNDPAVRDRIVDAYRRILELDPQNPTAQQYLNDVGAAPSSQPAPVGE